MNRLRTIALALLAALVLASTAAAASIDDVKALGYSFAIARVHDGGCTTYYISGYGVGIYADTCDAGFQGVLDSLWNAPAHCNRRWQIEHPDQFAAFGDLSSKGYSISGDQCADVYTVRNRLTGAIVYSGGGAGLVTLDATLGVATGDPLPTVPTDNPTATPPVVPPTCLPLCPDPAPPVATPGAAPSTPTATPPATDPTAAPAPTTTPSPATTPTTDPAPAEPAGQKTAAIAAFSGTLAYTVTLGPADVQAGFEDGGKTATALSHATGANVVITGATKCMIGARRIACSRLWNTIVSSSSPSATVTGYLSGGTLTASAIRL